MKSEDLMKKEYRVPSIRMVTLKAEEAVLTACKTFGNGTGAYMPGGNAAFGNCDVQYAPGQNRCNTIGS